MGDLRILVVEDAENWQRQLPKVLRRLGGTVQVDVVGSYTEGRQQLIDYQYDLTVVDLGLLGSPEDTDDIEVEYGMKMLHVLRHSQRNTSCALIVLTGRGTISYATKAFEDYKIDKFLEKDRFSEDRFIDAVRSAILASRLRQTRIRIAAQYSLTIIYNHESLLASNLSGPDRNSRYISSNPVPIDVVTLAKRGDNLNCLIYGGGADVWRPEARLIGDAIHTTLVGDQHILRDLIAAQTLGKHDSELHLQFEGPSAGLGIPFELLRDENDYLCFDHIITRKLAGAIATHKLESFDRFLETLIQTEQRLRILVIGANSYGQLPSAEAEATALVTNMEADLQQLGIAHEITFLGGTEATYDAVQAALYTRSFHLLHYAGHGYFDVGTAERSGLVLPDGNNSRVLTTTTLNLLMRKSKLHMVFLNCCVGARTTNEMGHGDFAGTMEAIARADVPIVLGHRWDIDDEPAMLFALAFYRTLWHTFSPGYALREARRAVAMGGDGWDDETWASPVLLMQNG